MNADTQTLPLTTSLRANDAEQAQRAQVRKRRLQKLIKRGLLLLALGLIGLAVLRALRPDPLTVELATVTRASLLVTVDETGRTRVKDRYLVSAPVAGRLARIELNPGDRVAAGAPVARVAPVPSPLIDPRTRAELEARVSAARFAERQAHTVIAQARSNLAQAEREAARARNLFASEALTPADLERAELALRVRRDELASTELGARVADEELRRARVALGTPGAGNGRETVVIRAPVAGQVLRVLQESEVVVPAGAPLIEVGDPQALEVVVDVLTAEAVAIRPGARVQIESWGGQAPIAGRVRRVEPAAFTRLSALGVEEQRVNVVVDLERRRADWAAMGDGFRVEVRIVADEVPSAIVAPTGAVIRSGSGWAVYRLDPTNRARLTPVTIGRRNPREVEVRAGVSPGDRLVLYPGDRLSDGAAVRTPEK